MSDSSDSELLAAFQAGDSAALGSLLARHEGPVFRLLFGLLKDHHRAEDALQETFVQALRSADRVDPSRFRGWLYTVAHQQAMLLIRKERRVPATAAGDALLAVADRAETPAQLFDRALDTQAALELLELLPVGQQAVIRMRLFDGLKFREVADALGCPLNTALARMHDGMKKLRDLWECHHA
jgi:RNA polymerase sigma-70 factor, ECF subfamily